MIIILSSSGIADPKLSTTLANVPSSAFGAKLNLGLYVPQLASNENLYIVASHATYNASNAPVIGETAEGSMGATIGAHPMTSGQVWTVQQLLFQLEDAFPQRYTGSVCIAVANVERSGSCRDFAGMFKTLLVGERIGGNVFYHPGSTIGPIFPAGDSRWQGVRALPVTASPLPITKLPEHSLSS